ncbi:MAG: DUF4368 domain-containing protein [[Eubacterium] siraeum]
MTKFSPCPDRSSGQRTQKIEIYYKAVGVLKYQI